MHAQLGSEYHPPATDLALLMRSDDATIAAFARSQAERTRARLALFCHERTHLREAGLVIARECSRFDLAMEGGHAGAFLYEQAAAGLPTIDHASKTRARITLSTTRTA